MTVWKRFQPYRSKNFRIFSAVIFSPSYIYNGRVAPTVFRWEILLGGDDSPPAPPDPMAGIGADDVGNQYYSFKWTLLWIVTTSCHRKLSRRAYSNQMTVCQNEIDGLILYKFTEFTLQFQWIYFVISVNLLCNFSEFTIMRVLLFILTHPHLVCKYSGFSL